jgi:hypothetical protein
MTLITLSLSFALFVSCNFPDKVDNFMEGKQSELVIDFDQIKQNIKIEARIRGIAGNHEEISIFQIDESVPGGDIVKQAFYTTELFYRKRGQDTLRIFAASSSYKKEILLVSAMLYWTLIRY